MGRWVSEGVSEGVEGKEVQGKLQQTYRDSACMCIDSICCLLLVLSTHTLSFSLLCIKPTHSLSLFFLTQSNSHQSRHITLLSLISLTVLVLDEVLEVVVNLSTHAHRLTEA